MFDKVQELKTMKETQKGIQEYFKTLQEKIDSDHYYNMGVEFKEDSLGTVVRGGLYVSFTAYGDDGEPTGLGRGKVSHKFLDNIDNEIMEKYFLKYLNSNKNAIFKRMAEMMDEDILDLQHQALGELHDAENEIIGVEE